MHLKTGIITDKMTKEKITRPSVVLFDWGGVLSVGGTPDELGQLFSEILPYDIPTIKDITKPLFAELKRGYITPTEFWNKLEAITHVAVSESHRAIWVTKESLRPNKELRDFTETLKSQGFQVGVLSNVFPNTAEMIRSEGWYSPYDPVFLSCDLGLAKPDIEIYEHAYRTLGVGPAEILFIDDQQKCLDPAASIGMNTILARSPQQVIEDVSRELGI